MKWVVVLALITASGGCFAWENDVDRGGYSFSKHRTEPSSGVHLGILAEDARVDSFVCRKGGWAHFNPDWSLRACVLAAPFLTEHFTFPAGAWVMPRADHLVVAFADDIACQGFVCTGSGGSKGTQSSFYWNGRLRSFFPPKDTMIGDILCAASPLAEIRLHENGQLSECRTASAGTKDGVAYAAGESLRLDEAGRMR